MSFSSARMLNVMKFCPSINILKNVSSFARSFEIEYILFKQMNFAKLNDQNKVDQ